jgi:hypothetical protein
MERDSPVSDWSTGLSLEFQCNVRYLSPRDNVRKQRVQMWMRRHAPSINTRLRWMFGRNCRLVARFE